MKSRKQTIYYTAPCDLWQGIIKDKNKVLDDVLCWQIVVCNYEIDKVKRDFSIKYGDERDSMKRARMLGGKGHSRVQFSISMSMFWDYYKNEKNEEDLLLLLFYLASKSIVGHKKYVLTNNRHVWCRMAGYESFKVWNPKNHNVDKIIIDHIRNDRKRQRKTAILREKAAASFLQYCSYSERGLRGFYFSTKATSKDEKTYIMREMKQVAKEPTKRQQEAERLRGIRNE